MSDDHNSLFSNTQSAASAEGTPTFIQIFPYTVVMFKIAPTPATVKKPKSNVDLGLTQIPCTKDTGSSVRDSNYKLASCYINSFKATYYYYSILQLNWGHGRVVTLSPPTSEFAVQNLDKLHVLVSSAHKTTHCDMTLYSVESDVKPHINKYINKFNSVNLGLNTQNMDKLVCDSYHNFLFHTDQYRNIVQVHMQH